MKKKFGDRYDGRRVRHCDPFNVIIPFIMRERNDAQVLFDAEIDVSEVEKIIRERRKKYSIYRSRSKNDSTKLYSFG